MRGIKSLVGAVALAVSTTAAADTIDVLWNSPVFSPASVNVGLVTHPGGTTGTNAGRFSGTASNPTGALQLGELYQSTPNNFFAYCHDLAQTLTQPGPTTYTVAAASARMLDFLGAVNSVLGSTIYNQGDYSWIATSTGTIHAAVQLGIWEALHGNDFDLSLGPVTVSSVPAGVNTQYNAFIAAMAGAGSLDGQYAMVLTHTGSQDVITARIPPTQLVPEPASLALFGAAALAAALVRRRRR